MTINAGALFTGKLAIRLQSEVQNAAWIAISNDGGFSGATWQPYRPNTPWTLRDPGASIATLLVYARFQDAQRHALCGGSTLSDDIIYDPLAPACEIDAIGLIQRLSGQMHVGAHLTTTTLHIAADDQPGGSGVVEMQFGFDPSLRDGVWQPFQPTIDVPARARQPIYIQVRDQVGNVSAKASAGFPYTVYVALPGR
jgi:hypothetical protein